MPVSARPCVRSPAAVTPRSVLLSVWLLAACHHWPWRQARDGAAGPFDPPLKGGTSLPEEPPEVGRCVDDHAVTRNDARRRAHLRAWAPKPGRGRLLARSPSMLLRSARLYSMGTATDAASCGR